MEQAKKTSEDQVDEEEERAEAASAKLLQQKRTAKRQSRALSLPGGRGAKLVQAALEKKSTSTKPAELRTETFNTHVLDPVPATTAVASTQVDSQAPPAAQAESQTEKYAVPTELLAVVRASLQHPSKTVEVSRPSLGLQTIRESEEEPEQGSKDMERHSSDSSRPASLINRSASVSRPLKAGSKAPITRRRKSTLPILPPKPAPRDISEAATPSRQGEGTELLYRQNQAIHQIVQPLCVVQ